MVKREILQATDGEQGDHHHKHISGNRKHPARLFHAAQIRPAHQHQQNQGNRHFVRQKAGSERRQRLGSSHQAHGRREGVIDQQRGGGHQSHIAAKVVACHHIGPATIGIGRNGLAIRQHHDGDQADDRQGDRHREAQSCTTAEDQDAERRFGGISHR